jgi:hypothetical protein
MDDFKDEQTSKGMGKFFKNFFYFIKWGLLSFKDFIWARGFEICFMYKVVQEAKINGGRKVKIWANCEQMSEFAWLHAQRYT